jgi:hypothetical protein
MSPMISVQPAPAPGGGWTCQVMVEAGGRRGRFEVSVRREDLERWAPPGTESPEGLVERAMEFLLAREGPDQILPRFGLADIQRYFPEFAEEFGRR